MTLDMVLRYWVYIEADFTRFYQCNQPLILSWRKFMVLFRGLPPTSTFALASGEERKLEAMSASERMEYYRDKQNRGQISISQLESLVGE